MARIALLKVLKQNPEQTVREVFAHWLKTGRVSALLVPAVSATGGVAPVLLTDPEKIPLVSPFLSSMSINAASIVAQIAANPVIGPKLALILRPCEMRAVVELIKLQQVARENLILIGMDCPGTYKPGQGLGKDLGLHLNLFLCAQDTYLNDEKMRSACRLCEFPTPLFFDLAIGFLGMNPMESLYLEAVNEHGESLLEGLNITPVDKVPEERSQYLARFIQARNTATAEKIKEFNSTALGPENLVRFFANCINCHNCMKVCPICYCRECFFESNALERDLDDHIRIVSRKGLNRMPAGTLLFHLTRMNHMMTSCVQCGICEDSCPAGISLSILFKKVSRNAQAEFGYLSGRSLDEPLPLTTFREDEFRQIGED